MTPCLTNSASRGRPVIPFQIPLSTLVAGRRFEEQPVIPFDAPIDRSLPDQSHLFKIRIVAATIALPLTDGRLVDADNLGERLLGDPENVRPDMLDCAHGGSGMPIGIICQACRLAFFDGQFSDANRHVRIAS